jgi:hypothetical protein
MSLPRFSVRVVPSPARPAGELRRTGVLCPYAAEEIADDALRAGPGARLEMTVEGPAALGAAWARRRFARLGAFGIAVDVRAA